MAGDADRKAELTAQLARARMQMESRGRGTRAAMNVSSRVRRGMARNQLLWMSGAVLFGIVLALWSKRPKKVVVKPKLGKNDSAETASTAGKAGMGLLLLKFVLDMARPALIRMATERLRPYADRMAGRWHERV